MMISVSAWLAAAVCAAAARAAELAQPLVVVDASGPRGAAAPMPSPWALAFVPADRTLYVSNFGAPAGARDYVASIAAPFMSGGQVVAELADVATTPTTPLDAMHVKDIAVAAGGNVYLAAFGGPGNSAVVACGAPRECFVLVHVPYEAEKPLQPAAIAVSEKLKRVFYSVVDGNLEEVRGRAPAPAPALTAAAAAQSAIYSVPVDGSSGPTLYVKQGADTGVAAPVGLAVDDKNGYVYWSNGAGPDRVQRGDLTDGAAANVGSLYTAADFRPYHLALDTAAQFLYFTDQEKHVVGRVDVFKIDSAEQLYDVPSEGVPHGIALDVPGKRVYWAETSNSAVWTGTLDDIGAERKPPAASAAAGLRLVAAAVAAAAAAALAS